MGDQPKASELTEKVVEQIKTEQQEMEEYREKWEKAWAELQAFNEELKKKYGLEIYTRIEPSVSLRPVQLLQTN